MAAPEYHLTTLWRVRGKPEEVFAMLNAPEELPVWWPAAFTDSLSVQTGEETGKRRVTRLESRGFLPGHLRWHQVTTASEPPHRLVTEIWGDIEGTGTWTIAAQGGFCVLTYDWVIVPRMALAGLLSPLVERILTVNHRWAMAKGEESLQIEIDRRRTLETPGASLIRQPPGPAAMPKWLAPFAFGAAFAVMTAKRKHKPRSADLEIDAS